MQDETRNETFEAFKESFSYGSRGDLNFKFLKHLSNLLKAMTLRLSGSSV